MLLVGATYMHHVRHNTPPQPPPLPGGGSRRPTTGGTGSSSSGCRASCGEVPQAEMHTEGFSGRSSESGPGRHGLVSLYHHSEAHDNL